MTKEDLADQFPPAAHARLIEDALQVLLHSVRRHEKLVRDLSRRLPPENEGAFNRGDIPTVMGVMDDNIKFYIPGRSVQSGTFTGKSGAGRYFRIIKEHTNGTHGLEVQEVLANDDKVVAIHRAFGERDGATFDMPVVHVLHMNNGKVSELDYSHRPVRLRRILVPRQGRTELRNHCWHGKKVNGRSFEGR